MIVIICEATRSIGYGHLKRCLTLAVYFRQLCLPVTFLMRNVSPVVASLLHDHGMDLIEKENHEDPIDCLLREKGRIRLVLIDHYEINADFEKQIFGSFSIVVIDDLLRPHWCDLLVDQTFDRKAEEYDEKLLSGSTRVLSGVKYTLMDPKYREGIKRKCNGRNRIKGSNRDKRNILITFGATDPEKIAVKVLEILSQTRVAKGLVFHLPLSSLSPCFDELEVLQQKSRIDIRLYRDLPDLSSLYEKCDIAIGAPGISLLERICCGLMNLTIVAAENQRVVGQNLEQRGVVRNLGDFKTLDFSKLVRELELITQSTAYGNEWIEQSKGLVDGKGAVRVIKECIGLVSPVNLRQADREDLEILFQWQHEKGARRYSRNIDPPSKKEHSSWFARVLESDNVILRIIEWCDMAVGYIRLNKNKNSWEVSILVTENFQGFGFAKKALLQTMKFKERSFQAFIHAENKASIALFTSAGFQYIGKDEYIYHAT